MPDERERHLQQAILHREKQEKQLIRRLAYDKKTPEAKRLLSDHAREFVARGYCVFAWDPSQGKMVISASEKWDYARPSSYAVAGGAGANKSKTARD